MGDDTDVAGALPKGDAFSHQETLAIADGGDVKPPRAKTNRRGYLNIDNTSDENFAHDGPASKNLCVETEGKGSEGTGNGKGDIGEDGTSVRLAIFGALNLIYVVLQLAGSMAFGSLALLSDGFHNLSDVAAIGMAMYIHKLQRRRCPENEVGGRDLLPYGYKRAEVIGGLMNSVALISLSAYILLNAIPRLIYPNEVDSGWSYMLLALGGVVVNLVGVLFFLAAGEDGHDHHHGGGFLHAHSHSHDHGHEISVPGEEALHTLTLVDPYDTSPVSPSVDEEPDLEKPILLAVSTSETRSSLRNRSFHKEMVNGDLETGIELDGSWIGGGGENRAHGHAHDHGGHLRRDSSGCEGGLRVGADARSRHCSGHVDQSGLREDREHRAHAGGVETFGHRPVGPANRSATATDAGSHSHSHDHAHGSDDGHIHGHEHANGHGHKHAHSGHGGGGCSGSHGGKSMNLWAVLVHAVSDAIASGIVCIQAAIIFVFGDRGRLEWTDYLDPVTSIMLSLFIVYCALPVVMECSHVLMEGIPRSTNLARLRKELSQIRGVRSIRDLSVMQLNSEEKFVGAVTIMVHDPDDDGALGTCAANGATGRDASACTKRTTVLPSRPAILESAKTVLARHNVGRSTVEINLASRGWAVDDVCASTVASTPECARGPSGASRSAGDSGTPCAQRSAPHPKALGLQDNRYPRMHSHDHTGVCEHSRDHGHGHSHEHSHSRTKGQRGQVSEESSAVIALV